jgi:hypothetical protein
MAPVLTDLLIMDEQHVLDPEKDRFHGRSLGESLERATVLCADLRNGARDAGIVV